MNKQSVKNKTKTSIKKQSNEQYYTIEAKNIVGIVKKQSKKPDFYWSYSNKLRIWKRCRNSTKRGRVKDCLKEKKKGLKNNSNNNSKNYLLLIKKTP